MRPLVLPVLPALALAAACLFSSRISLGDEPAQGTNPAGTLRAGAAASNITPPLGELIVGGFKPFPAKHVHDELHARCLVLDDGKTRIGIVLCDNVGIPREVYDAAREMLPKEAGLAPANILMAATHTHSATTARTDNRTIKATKLTDYQQFVACRIADGLVCAVNNLEPARIGFGQVDVPEEVFNRRWYLSGDEKNLRNPFGGVDKVRMNPPRASSSLLRPAGPVDPQVSFLSVQSVDGRPISLIANYSLHYVGGVRGADISADYFAVFADLIAEKLNAEKLSPPFVGILSNGTSGDVNNIDFRSKGERRKPYEKMREVAGRVADAVYGAHQKIEFRSDVTLAAEMTELTLGVRKPTEEQLAWARRLMADPENAPKWHGVEMNYARRALVQNESPDEVSVPLQALRIGDVGIAAIPFEVFTEIGLEIKDKSPLKKTFTIELANGSFAYLPTPEQHEVGGYETWLGSNIVEYEASRKITRTILDLLESISP